MVNNTGIMPTDAPPPYDASSEHQGQIEDAPPYPPPPGLSHEFSSGANATKWDSDNAAAWCKTYPLTPPIALSAPQLAAIRSQNHSLLAPSSFRGDISLRDASTRSWHVVSHSGCPDTLIQTALPAYAALADSPLVTERSRTVYFELRILRLGRATDSHHSRFLSHLVHGDEECGVALGFVAPPYPPFRLPGWQRGSIGVHSDDGRRYVGNTDGGVDFTEPFRIGETVGIGLSFAVGEFVKGGTKVEVDVLFTRDGRKAGGWNLFRESDAEDENLMGLMGDNDLFPALGVFGPVEVEVNFGESSWMYRGWPSRA
jgi:hypothetical protein